MATIGLGVKKQTRFSRQTAKGTLALVGGGQIIRRQQSTFELQKATYTTESEINSAQQLVANRHGERTVNGKIAGLLSPGTFNDLIGAAVRRDYAVITPIAGAGITIAGTGPTWTVTRAAGSFLTDGIKVGHVIRLSVGTFNAANLNKNLIVLSLTATAATVQLVNASVAPLVAEGPISGSTVSLAGTGKTTFVPATGHTNVYYTVEEWYPDVPTSERNQDCKVASLDITMPGGGNCTIGVNMLGLDQTVAATAYYTAPAVETTSPTLVGASGILIYNGVSIGTITNCSLKVDCKEAVANGVVGAVQRPDIFRGKVLVSGSITVYFDSTTLRDQFIAEGSAAMTIVMTTAATAAADLIAITLPSFDLNTSTPMDAESGMTRTYNIQAEYNMAGGAGQPTEQTTIMFQDTLA